MKAAAEDFEYKPVFFSSHFVIEKYYGWRCIHNESGLRVIRKQRGMFSKTLFMARDFDQERLSYFVNDRRFVGQMDMQIIHDFSRPPDEAGLNLGGRRFSYTEKNRILNVGTFVVDLSQSEEELFKNLDSNSRTKVRRAAKHGVQARCAPEHCEGDVDSFFDFYRPLAKNAGLDFPSRGLVERMISAGDLVTASAVAPDSKVVAVNLIYLCAPYAFDVWGAASPVNRINGAGHLLRVACMRWLKSRGIRWYDLGGVATTEPSDPIYSFKKTLGGRYVALGSEYRRMGMLTNSSYAILRIGKNLVRRYALDQRPVM